MKKRLTRLISGALMLCMIFSMVAPLTLFATDGETATEEREILFKETFSDSTYENGFAIATVDGTEYTHEDGTLKYVNKVSSGSDYFDLRFYAAPYPILKFKHDFVLSMRIKPLVDDFDMNFMWRYRYTSLDWDSTAFKIVDGCYQVYGVSYTDAKLVKDEWSLLEIVFRYDESKGITTQYTFMLDGNEIATVDAAKEYEDTIDAFRIAQKSEDAFEVDDIIIASGTDSFAETTSKNQGMSFTSDDYYKVPYKLDLSDPVNGVEAITFETEIYIPSDMRSRSIMLGSWTNREGSDNSATMNFETDQYGRVRFAAPHITGDCYFGETNEKTFSSHKIDETTGKELTNVFAYMDEGDGENFVKIAVVVNITDKIITLYINGTSVQSFTLTKATSGDLKLSQNFCVGGDQSEENSNYFKGNMRSVALYSDVRTEEEMLNGVNSEDENLLFAYDLTDEETPFNDLSNNGYHIYISGNDTTNEGAGMSFDAGELFKIPYKLDVSKPSNADEAITFEAEIFLPNENTSSRKGTIIGTYTNDPNVSSYSASAKMAFGIEEHGRVRFYAPHIGDVYFDNDGVKDTTDNDDITNVYTYMGDDGEAKFVKIAVVVNITKKLTTLYINGNKVKELTLTKAGTGDLKLPEYFYLGGDLRINNSQYFKGNIKNVTLYSDLRTDEEILASATAEKYSVNKTDGNLIFAYDLSSGSNADMKDISGNGYDVQFIPRFGKTLAEGDCNEMTKPLANAPKTIEATVYVPAYVSGRGTVIGNYNNALNEVINLEITENGKPKLLYSNNASGSTESYIDVNVKEYNDWVHIVFVYDDSGSDVVIKGYINGEEKTVISDNILPYSDEIINGLQNPLRIGCDYSGTDSIFGGYIKNIAIYSDARTAVEVANDYENGVSLSDENLLVAYDFTKVSDFKDISGNGYEIKIQDTDGLRFTQNELYRSEAKFSKVPHSFETWIYLPETISNVGGVIFGNGNGSATQSDLLNIEIYTNGNPRLCYATAEGVVEDLVFDKVDVRSDNWVHLAIVHDQSAGKVYCYLNGELKQTLDASAYYTDVAKNDTGMCIGGDMRNLGDFESYNNSYFKGAMKELAVYSDVRTATEIKNAYENGADTDDGGMISYYDLDIEAGTSRVNDIKTRNNVTTDWKYSTSGIDKSEYSYSFAVVGDTQSQILYDAKNGTTYTKTIYDWIAENKEKENIKYVFGMGDITENGNKLYNGVEADMAQAKLEWELAYAAIQPLRDAKLNYALISGNHENPKTYTDSFGGDTFMTDEIDGYYSTGDERLGNYYINFEVGETKYTFIALQFGAVDEILAWASGVVEANLDRRVIIATHGYMASDGTTLGLGDAYPPDSTGTKPANNGDEMWEKFVSQHANIVLVLSGHDSCENIVWRQDMGVNGNIVSQFLIDPQGMSPNTTGMVALFHFTADGSQVAVEYVSTHRSDDEYNVYYRNQNQFEFNLYEGAKENVYHVTGDADNYTAYYTNGKVTSFTAANTLATVNGYKLSLEGNIGVKSFMNIPVFTNTDKLYAKFTVDGEEFIQYFSEAENNATYGYGFKGLVSAVQMTSKIKIELYYDGVLLVSDTTSVAEYANVILENKDNNAEYEAAKGVVQAMLNYGILSNEYWNELESSGLTVGENSDAINTLAYSKISGTLEGVTYKSTTLGLKSETVLYHFFAVTDASAAYDVTCEDLDASYYYDSQKGMLVVRLDGISAANLDTVYTLTINGSLTVSCNAFAYAKAVINSTDTEVATDALKAVMNALYEYNDAANAYFGA